LRFLSAKENPGHGILADFRKRQFAALSGIFRASREEFWATR
jgi:hypothetical protein